VHYFKNVNNLHLRSFERRRFKVAKFSNGTTRLIHQMWDGMVTTIIIEKDNKMEIIYDVAQIDVEGSYVIQVPKKQNKNMEDN